jgi:ATP-dependent Clp protease ATP-binding subunit ClpC
LGNTVDFKNVILIMTSNIGARHLMKKQGLGFASEREDLVNDKVEELVKQEVKKTFNPEFLNRLDEVILFQSLSDADLMQIVELMVQQLNANLAQKSITISVTEEAKKWILDKTLTDRSYGARPLRRALQRYVEDPLSEALIGGLITARPAFIEVYLDANQLFYRPVSADETISDEEKPAGVLLYSA